MRSATSARHCAQEAAQAMPIGRTEFDSPDVDNEVLVKASETYVRIGDFANVLIERADHFDLYGVVVN